MAIQVLGRDVSAAGTWQIDYDDVGLTVGHTVTQGTGTRLVLTVTQVATGATFTRDVSADFGKGRVVDFSGIPNSAVPPHVKGQAYPFTFGGSWS